MRFIRSALIVGTIFGFTQSAFAATVNVAINNVSGKTISAIFATAKGEAEASTTNVFQGGQISVTSESDACVYTLTIQFSDSTSIDRPDVDLCQTEKLMVE
ncbi:MAG: hypothetical protein AB7F74_08270 [Parvibaculaceae bacterium]